MSNLREWIVGPRPGWLVRCLRCGLRLASPPYRLAIAARNAAYRIGLKKTHRSALKVISIGNLSVGGTGKTPAVAWVAQWLRQRDLRVAILSRGYGQLDSGQNDEALELELSLPDVPHLQHWDRVASAILAEEELDMQVLILDDGFQHRRLARDLDVVLIDASDPTSAWHLLPGGLLREPFSSLRRATVALLTRCDQATESNLRMLRNKVQKAAPGLPMVLTYHRPQQVAVYQRENAPLEDLKGAKALAFCGIGNPDSFFNSLKSLGVELLDTRVWPDHHAYTVDDIRWLADWTEQHREATWLLCTRKDWVKLQTSRIGRLTLGALEIQLEIIEGQSEFEKLLDACVAE